MDWMLRDRWLDALGLLEGLQLSLLPVDAHVERVSDSTWPGEFWRSPHQKLKKTGVPRVGVKFPRIKTGVPYISKQTLFTNGLDSQLYICVVGRITEKR